MVGSKLVLEGAITRSYERPRCSLPYAPLDPQSTHHHLLRNRERQPKSLSVGVDLQEDQSSYRKSRMKGHVSS